MDAQRRLNYLQAMDLEPWLPRTEQPGALKSALVQRKTIDPVAQPVAGSALAPSDPPAAIRAVENAASTNKAVPDISRLLDDIAPSAKPASKPMNSSPAERPAAERKPMVASTASAATPQPALFLLNCPGKLLVVDSGLSSRDQQHLLRNIVFALTDSRPATFQAIAFDGASIGASAGNPADVLHGLIERNVTGQADRRVLLMGAAAQQAFASSEAIGCLSQLTGFSAPIMAVLTHDSASLLSTPSLKAEVWAHGQTLMNG